VIDEFTHECLAIRVARKLKAIDFLIVLVRLIVEIFSESDLQSRCVLPEIHRWLTIPVHDSTALLLSKLPRAKAPFGTYHQSGLCHFHSRPSKSPPITSF
jgi:hypothetical protein